MKIRCTLIATMVLGTVNAQPNGPVTALFAEEEVVAITITAPMRDLTRERPNEEYLPGTLSYAAENGSTVTMDIGVRTRGKFRRQKRVCPFPPLRLNFDKSQVEGTLFQGQNKLKLVAHCRDGSERYDQGVIREYLAYRILNAMTDVSYRVRLLRITYRDSAGEQDDREQFGFLIEHKSRLAKRIELPEIEITKIRTEQLDGAYSDLTSLFQFLIANTDFSPILGPQGEDCCHNTTLFGIENQPIYAIPYDFDMSGLVDAPYAEPNPRFKIRSVKQRLYRGRCLHNDHLDDSVKAFQENRRAIEDLIKQQPELSPRTRKSMLRFIEDFYEVIDEPKRLERRIRDRCI